MQGVGERGVVVAELSAFATARFEKRAHRWY
jgi:hypothetical protein